MQVYVEEIEEDQNMRIGRVSRKHDAALLFAERESKYHQA